MSKIEWINESKVKIEISATEADLSKVKQKTLKYFQPVVTAPGFRKGKVPLSKVESNVDDNMFKSRFLDDALTFLFDQQIIENKIRPVGQPQVEILKFVPYSILDFSVTVDVIGKIKLGSYKNLKIKPEPINVSKKEIDEVISNLRIRLASKEEVNRKAQDGDEVYIDFHGKDKDGKDVSGASGKDYPLALGSDTFIKGFEPEIVGMKIGQEKTFTVRFPKDYGHKPLANKDVTFTVKLNKVNQVTMPEVNDKFAADAGPFKTVDELKHDIEKQLSEQKAQEADAKFKDDLIRKIVETSEITVPESLLKDQTEVELSEFKQNLTYRGMSLDDYLSQAATTQEEFIDTELKPVAERKVKVGLVLSEIAAQEKLTVSDEEIAIRLQLLKGQYKDEAMQAQLDAPESQREVASRLLSEKTINKIVEYSSKSN